MVNNFKGRSSRLLRCDMPDIKEKYWGKAGLWSKSYFAGSVGGAPLEIVKQYIQNQATPEDPLSHLLKEVVLRSWFDKEQHKKE